MNEITEKLPFSERDIDFQNYTASVLRLCSANRIITDEKINEIRSGLDKAFVETAEQYTKRESSTIPKKQAELLYSSVLYQCDIYLLSLKSLKKAIDELNILPIEIILDRGQKIILNLHKINLKIFVDKSICFCYYHLIRSICFCKDKNKNICFLSNHLYAKL